MEKTKLTKAVIIEHLHDKLGINRNDIHQIVDEFFEEVKDGLKDEKVIAGNQFGTLYYPYSMSEDVLDDLFSEGISDSWRSNFKSIIGYY